MKAVTEKPKTATILDRARTYANDLLNQYAANEAAKQQLKEQTASIDAKQDELKAEMKKWVETYSDGFGGKKTYPLDAGSIGYKKEGERLVWAQGSDVDECEGKLLKLLQSQYDKAVEPKVNKTLLLKAMIVLPNLAKNIAKLGASVRNNDQFTITLNKRKAGDE